MKYGAFLCFPRFSLKPIHVLSGVTFETYLVKDQGIDSDLRLCWPVKGPACQWDMAVLWARTPRHRGKTSSPPDFALIC